MKYFTRFNRDMHFVMLHLWYLIDKWLKDKGCQLLPKEKKDLRSALTIIWDVAERLFKRLDSDYGKKVIRDLETTNLVTQRSTQSHDEICIMSRKNADYLGDMMLMFCNSHLREGCIKYKKCRLYQALADAGVPVGVLETNACPYRNESYSKKTGEWTTLFEVPKIGLPYRQNVCPKCGQLWFAYTEAEAHDECPACHAKLGVWR